MTMHSIARLGAIAGACMALAGCAAIQIDVDVYKGPLANTHETQRQQLASMALSAAPLILEYRNLLMDGVNPEWAARPLWRSEYILWREWSDIEEAHKKRSAQAPAVLRHARQLNLILSWYKGSCKAVVTERLTQKRCNGVEDTPGMGLDQGRPPEGLETLFTNMTQVAYVPGESDEERQRVQAEAFDKFERALVDFAGQVQFYTNNQWVLDVASSQEPDGNADRAMRLRTLLETVSNTILVQADEMRRSGKHDGDQHKQHAAEMNAVYRTFGKVEGASRLHDAYDRLQREAEQLLKPKPSPAPTARPGALIAVSAEDAAKMQQLLKQRKALVEQSASLFGLMPVTPPPQGAQQALQIAGVSLKDHPLRSALQQSLNTAGQTVTLAALKQNVVGWATAEMNGHADVPENLRSVQPDYRLLQLASEAAKRLKAEDEAKALKRGEAISALRKAISRQFEKEALEFRRLDEQYGKFAAAPPPPVAADPSQLNEQEQQQALTLLGQVREEVLLAVAKLPEAEQARALPLQVKAALDRRAAPGAAGRHAVALGDTVTRIRLPEGPVSLAHARIGKPIDVVDSVIANLRYEHLHAVSVGGEHSEKAKNLAAALAQARKYRQDMVYVRPSSAYLRSALPATFAQENPHVRWNNMLNDTLLNITRSVRGKDPMTGTREDLDKVFWQNINRVRLSAGGFTNYVLAKDDVGNWYIKGMGADPTAMITAAKNLALFNLGGRLNTDLLRIDELRNRIDNDRDGPSEMKTSWENEVSELRGGSSGPAVTDRGHTLDLFRANYDKQTSAQLEELSKSLAGYPGAIEQRWTAGAASAETLAILKGLLAEHAKNLPDAKTASAGVPATRAAPEAVIDTLQALERYRAGLRTAVATEARLLAEAEKALTLAQEAVGTAGGKVQEAQKTLATRSAAVAAATAELGRQPAPAEDALPGLRNTLNAAIGEHQKAMADYEQKLQELGTRRAEAAVKSEALAATRQRRQRAADDVDFVLRRAIEAWVQKRMRTIEEFETAANVVGRR
jgi:hypothetical protein